MPFICLNLDLTSSSRQPCRSLPGTKSPLRPPTSTVIDQASMNKLPFCGSRQIPILSASFLNAPYPCVIECSFRDPDCPLCELAILLLDECFWSTPTDMRKKPFLAHPELGHGLLQKFGSIFHSVLPTVPATIRANCGERRHVPSLRIVKSAGEKVRLLIKPRMSASTLGRSGSMRS